MMGGTQLTIFRRHDEGLWDKIEILETFEMLHAFDVFKKAILPGQFERSWKVIDSLMWS